MVTTRLLINTLRIAGIEKAYAHKIFATVIRTQMKNSAVCLPQYATAEVSLGCHCYTIDEVLAVRTQFCRSFYEIASK